MRTFICNFWGYIAIFSVILGMINVFGSKKRDDQNEYKYTGSKLFKNLGSFCIILILSITAYCHMTSSKVPNVVGCDVSNAVQTLQEDDLNMTLLPNDYNLSDKIVEQNPEAGVYLSKGSVVQLYVEHSETSDSSDKRERAYLENISNNTENFINETDSTPKDVFLSSNIVNKNQDNSLISPPITSTSASTSMQEHTSSNSNLGDINSSVQSSNDSDILVPDRYIFLKTSLEDEGSLIYVDSEDVTHHISDPDISDIKTYIISLYANNDKVIGADINITLQSGAGIGLAETFYDGISFEISAGTYVVELIGEPYTDSLYIENEDGSVTYGNYVFSEIITIDHDGDYNLNVK